MYGIRCGLYLCCIYIDIFVLHKTQHILVVQQLQLKLHGLEESVRSLEVAKNLLQKVSAEKLSYSLNFNVISCMATLSSCGLLQCSGGVLMCETCGVVLTEMSGASSGGRDETETRPERCCHEGSGEEGRSCRETGETRGGSTSPRNMAVSAKCCQQYG